MALQFSVPVRNDELDSIQATIGPSAILMIRSGPVPANCAAPDAGLVLATLLLPVVWMLPAIAASKAYNPIWQDLLADATGIAAHFRMYDNGLAACHMQGTVTMTGLGGDMTVDNTNFALNQAFTVTGFTINGGNA